MTDIIVIAAGIAAIAFFIHGIFFHEKSAVSGDSRDCAVQSAEACRSQVVRIRHAGGDVVVEVAPPEPFYGPLSDDSILDERMWDRIRSGGATPEEIRSMTRALNAIGFRVEVDSVRSGDKAGASEQSRGKALPETAPGPSQDCGMDYLRDLIIDGLRNRLCTPAFALLASREHGFELEFEDGGMRERSLDPLEVAEAEKYRDMIRESLSEAIRAYAADHPFHGA